MPKAPSNFALESNSRQFVVAVGSHVLAAVLLEIGMPRMDGYEVARRLPQEPGLEGVVLVALTGYGHEEDHRRSRQSTIDYDLSSPWTPSLQKSCSWPANHPRGREPLRPSHRQALNGAERPDAGDLVRAVEARRAEIKTGLPAKTTLNDPRYPVISLATQLD